MVLIFIKQVFGGLKITKKAQEFTRMLIFNYNISAICIFSNQFERKSGYIKKQELAVIMKYHFILLTLSNVA